MMIASPSWHSSTAARAIARFCAWLTDWLCQNDRALKRACRMNRLGAAAHLAQAPLVGERGDIAPDRRLRSAGEFHDILHGDDGPFLDRAQDDAMAFALVHPASPLTG